MEKEISMLGDNQGNKLIVKNTLFLYFRMGVVLLITLYTSRVILRTLGVVDYGIFNVVAGFVTMFTFLNNAMSASIQRFFSFERGKNKGAGVRKVFTTAVYTQFLLAIILIVIIEAIGIWYINNKMVIPDERMEVARLVFHISVVSVFFVVMSVPFSGAVLAYEKMDFYAAVGIVDVFFKLVIALALPHVSYDKLASYAFLLLITTIISFMLSVIYVKRMLKDCYLERCFDKGLFKSMVGFSGWHAFSTAGTMMGNQGINMIINIFYGPVVNAARGISYQVNSAVMGFVRNITIAARPQMIQSYAEGNNNRSLKLMYGISKICFLLCYLMLLPICLEIDSVLGIWLGHDSVPEYANVFTRWVLVTSLICTLDTPITTLVHATGTIRNYHVISTIVSLFALPIGYCALKYTDSPVSIFIVNFILIVLGQVIGLFLLKQVYPFSIFEYVKCVIVPLLSVVVLSFIPPSLFSFLEPGLVRFLLVLLTSVVSVVYFAYLVGLNKSEKGLVMSIIRKVIKSKILKLRR